MKQTRNRFDYLNQRILSTGEFRNFVQFYQKFKLTYLSKKFFFENPDIRVG